MDSSELNAQASFEVRDARNFRRSASPRHDEQVIRATKTCWALVVGHEFAHISQRHVVLNAKRDRTEFLRVTYGRDQEIEADLSARN